MKVVLDEFAIAPTRAHPDDAGLDLYTPSRVVIPAEAGIDIDTGVHVQLPEGTVGMLKSKSGLNVKHHITSEGVIDEGYTGSIVVKLYNHGLKPYMIGAGEKISQLVVLPVIRPEVEIVDELDETERGNNGFGSSGK